MTLIRDKCEVKVENIGNRYEIFVDNKYIGFFVINDETCSADFTFIEDFECNKNFPKLIIDEYLKDSD